MDTAPILPRVSSRTNFRAHRLDNKVLFFDRASGTKVLVENERTLGLRRTAPRAVMLALTNACNKACHFCYRPPEAESRSTFDSVVELARFLDEWGVLELTFGGGEPTNFPRFAELVCTIWDQTKLCPSFTTNGLTLERTGLLRAIRGKYGQVQLSVYDEDSPLDRVAWLAKEGARFGLNYLVTPARVRTLEADLVAFFQRGARDVLLLSYKGADEALHLSANECAQLDESIVRLKRVFGAALTLKVDVCWGTRLKHASRLFDGDCGAGSDFLSITSDLKVLACSFSGGGATLEHPSELPAIWARLRQQSHPAHVLGCTRTTT
jgi:MoaA/NifB/PqqE/SkfB family radical SAM enzyme